MYIYLIVFLASGLLIYMGEEKFQEIKVISYLLIIVAIFLPSYLAGVRDYTIGTDVLGYGNIWFHNAVTSFDFHTYIEWATSSSIASLYACFNYLISRFTTNPHYFYFWYSFVENIVAFSAVQRNKDIIDPLDGWMTYLFLYFNFTLNILRNGMALLILLWGFKYIRKSELWKFLIVVFIASLFHSSAYLGIIVYVLYQTMKKTNTFILKESVYGILLIIVLFYKQFFSLLQQIPFLSNRYAAYLNTSDTQRGGFLIHLIILCMPILIIYEITRSQILTYKSEYLGLRSIIIFSTILSLMSIVSSDLLRIVNYFDIYFIIAVPFICGNSFKWNYKGLKINKLIMYLYLIVYWIVVYVVFNSGETVPYIYMTNI